MNFLKTKVWFTRINSQSHNLFNHNIPHKPINVYCVSILGGATMAMDRIWSDKSPILHLQFNFILVVELKFPWRDQQFHLGWSVNILFLKHFVHYVRIYFLTASPWCMSWGGTFPFPVSILPTLTPTSITWRVSTRGQENHFTYCQTV